MEGKPSDSGPFFRGALSEFLGSALLLTAIVGSGFLGERWFSENPARVLLVNGLSTGIGLSMLIVAFGRISGAHFNPAVTLAEYLQGNIPAGKSILYIACQVLGALAGVVVSNLMFSETVFQFSTMQRSGWLLFLSELVCTFGLILVIRGTVRHGWLPLGMAVGIYITAGILVSPSTAFANPAVELQT